VSPHSRSARSVGGQLSAASLAGHDFT